MSSKSCHYTANFASINAKFSVDGWDRRKLEVSQATITFSEILIEKTVKTCNNLE